MLREGGGAGLMGLKLNKLPRMPRVLGSVLLLQSVLLEIQIVVHHLHHARVFA